MRKIIAEARESLTSGESFYPKKLKFSKYTLEDKPSELKSLNEGFREYILDDSQIQENVGACCDFASAIQGYIVDLETTLISKRDYERSFSQSAESGLNSVQAGSSTNVSIYSHTKLPKLELRKFFGNPID